MNVNKIATALRALADAFEEVNMPDAVVLAGAGTAPPAPRGRGRPPKVTEAPPAAPAPAPEAPDPFTGAAAPPATLDEVRAALTALKAATSQEFALKVLKDAGGANNLSALTAGSYGAVAAAAKAAMPGTEPEVDPFETPTLEPAGSPQPTLEDVKAAVVAATKRTAADTVQRVVMINGGTAPTAAGGPAGPSLKALAPSSYAAVIAAVNNLPTTK